MKTLKILAFCFFFCLSLMSSCSGREEEPENNLPKLQQVNKWLALGNSITRFPISDFWWGDWGMAATTRDKDWVHVLNRRIKTKFGPSVTFKAYNIYPWEYDPMGKNKSFIDTCFAGDEDLVVIRLGENVPNKSEVMATYQKAFENLIDYVRLKAPNAKIIVTGNFWKNDAKDSRQKAACLAKNCQWVKLSQFDTAENRSTVNTMVYGDDNRWHQISEGDEHANSVAYHTNDKGMEAIAEAIFAVI